jgi:tetratricopeptide (TPR) repeat protein
LIWVVNSQVLREQARSGITYAPGLTYAPVQRKAVTPVVESAVTPVGRPTVVANEDVDQARAALREGKRLLRVEPEPRPGPAMVQFKKALMLTRMQGDRILERRAMRGLAAAKRLQGDIKGSVADFKAVLVISEDIQEHTGDTDALGTIADLLTEIGDIEEAGKYYDRYLVQLQTDNEATL